MPEQERYQAYLKRKMMEKPIMCQHCKAYTPKPFWVAKEFGRGTEQLAFCDESHANEYYLDKLRRAGI